MANIFSIGQSALTVAQAGVNTAAHNIANAATPGYNRQTVVQVAGQAGVQATGNAGMGAQVSEIKRNYSSFLGSQLLSTQSQSSQLEVQYGQIQQIDNLLADSSVGLAPALQDFFNTLQDVSTAPADATRRQSVLFSADSVTTRFKDMSSQLDAIGQGVNSQIESSVQELNSAAQRLVGLNQAIVNAKGLPGGQPNDLLDQRDQLLRDLSKVVKISVSQQDDQVSVYIGNGQPLVAGAASYQFKTQPSRTDSSRLEVVQDNGSGAVALSSQQQVGGALGGLLAFRDQTLAPAQNALGLVALGLASGINAQQAKGYDQTGAAGKPLFELPPVGVTASSSNQGVASLGAELGDISKLTASDFTLRRAGDQYQLLRSPDQQVLASSANVDEVLAASADQGFTLKLSGGLQAGDSFLIRPTAHAASGIGVALQDGRGLAAAASQPVAAGDSDNLRQMIGLQDAKTLNGGTSSVQSAYVQLVGRIGSQTRELQLTSQSASQINTQAETALQNASGVNLDEEATNLMRYQQAYQAAGKVMQMAQQLFSTVLEMGR